MNSKDEALISHLHEIEKVIGQMKCGCSHIAANHDKDGCKQQCECVFLHNNMWSEITSLVAKCLEKIKN